MHNCIEWIGVFILVRSDSTTLNNKIALSSLFAQNDMDVWFQQ